MIITRCFEKLQELYIYERRRFYFRRKDRRKIKNFGADLPKLTPKEKNEIKTYWKKFGITPDYDTFRWYYGKDGIKDPRYISEGIYDAYVWSKFNDMRRCESLNDKNMFDIIFKGYNMAKAVVHCISGNFFDESYSLITREEAFEKCKPYKKLAIKPSVGGFAGKGVECVEGNKIDSFFDNYGTDFIVQELIEQNDVFSKLNSSSVNVVRVTSLLFDGKQYVIDSLLRVGSVGSFTDHKNIAIGIDKTGKLKNYGVRVNGEKVSALDNGFVFAGITVTAYDEMISLAKELHRLVPQAGIIGWDFTCDKDGKPLLIEPNIWFPGVMRGQDCNGPCFGELTDIVMKYLTNRN